MGYCAVLRVSLRVIWFLLTSTASPIFFEMWLKRSVMILMRSESRSAGLRSWSKK
jgi:hypothetical protein